MQTLRRLEEMVLNVLDLFSGIGGFSLGLERAGMQTVGFVEIDGNRQRILAKHWPHVPIHGDIRTAYWGQCAADVICGGFPCQDISLAGPGTGLAGERSGLYRELVRAIRLVRPRYAIVENVAALLGRGMGTVLGDLAEIGYDAEWHCIPACAVGAFHERDRVWIVADPGGEQHESNRPPLSGEIATQLAKAAADAHEARLEERERQDAGGARPDGWPVNGGSSQWATEPDVVRVVYGVPKRMDRVSALGNAVVPQIPEIIGRAIMNTLSPNQREEEGR